ncbi:MAG: transcription antitermination factor NusB [Flavobacteriaceae bacterium TMED206]|nr:MAG: transcription antitermination factor NusB [Flavobacteriaceae bacterium TMED206]
MKIINRRQIRVKVLQELYSFLSGNENSLAEGQKNIINSFIQTNTLYLFYLNFFKSFWEFTNYRDNYQRMLKKSLKPIDENYTLISELSPLKFIAKNKNLITKLSADKTIFWDNKDDFLNGFFFKIVESELFREYIILKEKDYKAQLKLLIYIFKEILVYDKKFLSYIEDQNIYWVDDVPLINTFLLRLIKTLKSKKDFNFFKKSFLNTEKDIEFALKLFKIVIEKSEKLEKDIQSITLNWDIERIAPIDKLIIKMSMTELIYFSEIPETVSINEYLEISKEYSSPKSSQFINGVLDNVINRNK